MKKIRVAILALSSLCAGCVYGPQQVRIAPELDSPHAIAGAGRTIKLSVADERATKSLGRTDEGADFTLQGRLAGVIESAIRTALEKQGFNSSRNAGKDTASLHVEIRVLEYDVKPGFLFKSVRARSEINAVCKSASGAGFAKPYVGLIEKSAFFLGGERNGESLSTAISEAIDKLLDDKELGPCLTG